MTRQLNATTTGTPTVVSIADLGEIQFVHPSTTDLLGQDTGAGLTEALVKESADLQAAIDGGSLTLADQDGNVITDLSLLGTDTKVKVSATDTTPSVLEDKVQGTLGKVTATVVNPGANEKIQFNLGPTIFDTATGDSDDITEGAVNKYVTANQQNALNAASAPTGGNPFLTLVDAGTAQYNANKIDGLNVTTAGIGPNDILVYNNTTMTFEPGTFTPGSAAGWTQSGLDTYLTDTSTGKVSIGATTGTEKLNVFGNIFVSGTVDGRDVALDGTNLDNHIADLANPHQVTKTQVGLSNVDNVQQIPLSEKGQPNGVATLDATGKVPVSQIPSIDGPLEIIGNWNATTNIPVLGDSGVGGSAGHVYIVSVDGNTSLDGITDWVAGDWVVNTGSVWIKQDNTDKVLSVAGKTGNVLLDHDDITDFDIGVQTNADVAANSAHRTTVTGNPHAVTATEVGKDTAQWNADEIQGVNVSTTAPTDGQLLQYNATTMQYEPITPETALAGLSVDSFATGRNGSQGNGYLRHVANTPSNLSPYTVPWPATIYKITATDSGTANEWRGQVREDLGPAAIAEVIVLAGEDEKVTVVDVDVPEGANLSVYMLKGAGGSGAGNNISRPTVIVHLKRRNP